VFLRRKQRRTELSRPEGALFDTLGALATDIENALIHIDEQQRLLRRCERDIRLLRSAAGSGVGNPTRDVIERFGLVEIRRGVWGTPR
jgi:hypothetical protein